MFIIINTYFKLLWSLIIYSLLYLLMDINNYYVVFLCEVKFVRSNYFYNSKKINSYHKNTKKWQVIWLFIYFFFFLFSSFIFSLSFVDTYPPDLSNFLLLSKIFLLIQYDYKKRNTHTVFTYCRSFHLVIHENIDQK